MNPDHPSPDNWCPQLLGIVQTALAKARNRGWCLTDGIGGQHSAAHVLEALEKAGRLK